MLEQHTDKFYDEELKNLKENILKMSSLVEEMIMKAMKALVERDSQAGEEVIHGDRDVNRLEMEVDDLCFKLLALRQPAGSDLRFIIMGLKVSKDLERMGDLAVNIAQNSMDLNKEPPLKPYINLPQMAQNAQQMVKLALDSFVNQDAELAQKVCEMDDAVDGLYRVVQADLKSLMKSDPQAIDRAVFLFGIARHLERVADHATNVAEQVVFMISGKDIRHFHNS